MKPQSETVIPETKIQSYNTISCFNIVLGLPKAAIITHIQSLKAAAGFWAYGATKNDVVYTPLPLYHSAA